MRNQVLTLIFVLLVVCDEGKAAPKLDIAPRFEATELSAQFKLQGTDGNVWRIAQAQPAASRTLKTFSEGIIAGQAMAENHPTGGKVVGGFVTGLLSGLLGTGIGYFIVGPGEMDFETQHMMSSSGHSFDYQKGFALGWDKKTRSRKRNAFLWGGILGTAAFMVFIYPLLV